MILKADTTLCELIPIQEFKQTCKVYAAPVLETCDDLGLDDDSVENQTEIYCRNVFFAHRVFEPDDGSGLQRYSMYNPYDQATPCTLIVRYRAKEEDGVVASGNRTLSVTLPPKIWVHRFVKFSDLKDFDGFGTLTCSW